MKVKTVKELEFMSEELQVAYVHKCIDYFDKKFPDAIKAAEKFEDGKMTEEEADEYVKLLRIFQYSRMTDTY